MQLSLPLNPEACFLSYIRSPILILIVFFFWGGGVKSKSLAKNIVVCWKKISILPNTPYVKFSLFFFLIVGGSQKSTR